MIRYVADPNKEHRFTNNQDPHYYDYITKGQEEKNDLMYMVDRKGLLQAV